MKSHRPHPFAGFTLVEILVVIGLLILFTAITIPVVNATKERAAVGAQVTNLRNLTLATLQWANENGQALPSPEYPGGYSAGDRAIPKNWDFARTGTGLWLDGVIYHALYRDRPFDYQRIEAGTAGAHLKDTVFFSEQSHKQSPADRNWYRHSYAMNRSLQHNPIYSTSPDPELTNKRLARLPFRASALLFTENETSNVIGFEDRNQIIATAQKRWKSGKAVSSFLDGSVELLGAEDIPAESRRTDRESCKFWSGVRPAAFSCGSCDSKGKPDDEETSEEDESESGETEEDPPPEGEGGGEVIAKPPC